MRPGGGRESWSNSTVGAAAVAAGAAAAGGAGCRVQGATGRWDRAWLHGLEWLVCGKVGPVLHYRLWLAADVVVMMVVVAAGSRGGAAAPTSRLVTLAVGRRGPVSPRATGRVAATATVAARPWCCAPESAASNQRSPVPCRPPAPSLPAQVSRRCMFRSWSRSAFFVSLHCSFFFPFLFTS